MMMLSFMLMCTAVFSGTVPAAGESVGSGEASEMSLFNDTTFSSLTDIVANMANITNKCDSTGYDRLRAATSAAQPAFDTAGCVDAVADGNPGRKRRISMEQQAANFFRADQSQLSTMMDNYEPLSTANHEEFCKMLTAVTGKCVAPFSESLTHPKKTHEHVIFSSIFFGIRTVP